MQKHQNYLTDDVRVLSTCTCSPSIRLPRGLNNKFLDAKRILLRRWSVKFLWFLLCAVWQELVNNIWGIFGYWYVPSWIFKSLMCFCKGASACHSEQCDKPCLYSFRYSSFWKKLTLYRRTCLGAKVFINTQQHLIKVSIHACSCTQREISWLVITAIFEKMLISRVGFIAKCDSANLFSFVYL